MRTCLVVDPSHVVRKVARRIFETMQFETSEAESGQEALEKCEAQMPDAILLDGRLPTMGNVELLSSLRALPNGRKPIVIYCTTENDSSELARPLPPAPTNTSSSRSTAKAFAPSSPQLDSRSDVYDAPLSLSRASGLARADAGGRAASVTPDRISTKPTTW